MNNKILILVLFISSNIVVCQTGSLKIDSQIDSVFVQKNISIDKTAIEIENELYNKFVSKLNKERKEETSIWTTLIPLLIGAGLTLLTQFLIKFRKVYKKKTKD